MFFKRKKGSKYKNQKISGYDSKKEFKRAKELELLIKSGVIKNLEEQKKFVLQEKFRDNMGKIIREITYITDFYYYDCEKGKWVAEDVKGFKTDVYKIKAKMFKYCYPDIIFIES